MRRAAEIRSHFCWQVIFYYSNATNNFNTSDILRQFNPAVKGHSVGNKFGFDIVEQDWFNVAVPGARARQVNLVLASFQVQAGYLMKYCYLYTFRKFIFRKIRD